jgi:predicted transcriptional regulator
VNRVLNVLRVRQQRKCREIMTRGVIFANPYESVLKASETMVRHAVSQLPVLDRGRLIGTITEESIVRNLRSNLANEKVRNVMDSPLPSVSEDASLDVVRAVLERSPGVLVKKGLEVVGIVTRSDLLETIE